MSSEPDISFSITADRNESDESVQARIAIDPSFQASATIKSFDQTIGNLAMSSLHDHLNKQIKEVPPLRQNSCRLFKTETRGGGKGQEWQGTDKNSWTEQ